MSLGEFEGHEAIVAQLQAGTLDAPGHLHRRVLEGGRVKRRRWAEMSGRRRVLLVVPVAAALAVGGAVVHGAFFNGSSNPVASSAPQALGSTLHRSPATSANNVLHADKLANEKALAHTKASLQEAFAGYPNVAKTHAWTAAYGPEFRTADSASGSLSNGLTGANGAIASIPTNRKVHADATLQVAVPSTSGLTRAEDQALQIVTKLGGYEQDLQSQATRKGDGLATLDLRVPVGKANLAIQRIGHLGVLVSSSVATQDLQRQYSKQTDTVGRLRRAIAIYEQALNSGSLTYSQRISTQIQLSNAKYQLKAMLKSRSRTAAYAATTDISLTLSTNKNAFVLPPTKRGRLGNLLHNAGHFLALEGVIVLVALIVAGPIVLLLALLWWLNRERKRREEKLLAASA